MTETKTAATAGAEETTTIKTEPDKGAEAGKDTTSQDTEQFAKQNKKLIADLQKEREERKSLSDRIATFEKEKSDREAAEAEKQGDLKKLLDLERSSKEKEVTSLTQTVTGMKERLIRSELKALAAKEGIIDLDLVDLIPRELVKLNDQTHEVTGAEDAIKAFKASKGHLFGQAQTAGQAAATTPAKTGANVTPAPRTTATGGDIKPNTPDAKQAISDFHKKFRK